MFLPAWKRLVAMYGKAVAQLLSTQDYGSPEFMVAAERLARRMAEWVEASNAKGWRQAAFQAGRGGELYRALQHEIRTAGLRPELDQIARRNADLIRSVPEDVAQSITRMSRTMQEAGSRPEAIVREIRRRAPELTKSKIKMIAHTEIGRAETDLNRARSLNLGLDWYIWSTSRDSRVRPSHRFMDGVLVNWNDPPSPEALIGEKSTLGHYHSSCCPWCRCSSLSVADIAQVQFPARVYRVGRVTRMGRRDFARIAGLERAA